MRCWFVFLTALVFVGGASAQAQSSAPPDADPTHWRFQIGYLLRSFHGTTQVREFSSAPTRLSLRGDLGLEAESGAHAEALWDGHHVRALVEADYIFLRGGGRLNSDFFFDEGSFSGGIPFDVTGAIFFMRGTIAWKTLFDFGEHAWLGPVVGIEYPNFVIEIDQSPVDTTGEHWSQFSPYPVLGLAGEWQISTGVDVRGRVTGSYVNNWPTHRKEGGRLHMTAKTVNAELLLGWRVNRVLTLSGGLQYQYWDGNLHSREDGNKLTFSSPGLILGAELRF